MTTSFYLVHNGKQILSLRERTQMPCTNNTIFRGTEDECKAEAARLKLTDPNIPVAPVVKPNPANARFKYAEVAAWRLKAVAALAGMTPAIDAYLAALPEPAKTVATAAWVEGNTFDINSTFIVTAAAALNIPNDKLRELFTQAAGLQV